MRQFYFLLTSGLLFFSENSFAQLTNGTKTFGGFGQIETSFSKIHSTSQTLTQVQTNTYRSSSFGLSIAPTLGYYKNRFLVGSTVATGIYVRHSKSDFAPIVKEDTRYNFSYDVNPFVRYYTLNNSKFAHFIFAQAGIYGTLSNDKLTVGNTTISVNEPPKFTWQAGVGGHRFLTNQLVVEGVLSYDHNKNIAFYAGIRHFYKTFDRKNQDAPPQYLAKNRWQIDGGLSSGYNLNRKNSYLYASAFGGKMLTNHFMVGSGFSTGFNFPSGGNLFSTSLSISPFVRYYIPISNRFFAFPSIGSSIYLLKTKGSPDYANINFERGLGLQYFLTPNLALSGTAKGDFSLSKNQRSDVRGNGSIFCGFSYFIK